MLTIPSLILRGLFSLAWLKTRYYFFALVLWCLVILGFFWGFRLGVSFWLQLTLDLVRDWLERNMKESLLGNLHDELNISGLATYQPYDGLMDLKIVSRWIDFLFLFLFFYCIVFSWIIFSSPCLLFRFLHFSSLGANLVAY